MRSIGKKGIKEVQRLVDTSNITGGISETIKYVRTHLHEKIANAWEGAYTEIQRIVYDYCIEKENRS